MTGNKFGEIFQRYIFPFLPPLVAAAMLVIQQLYYPATRPIMTINILLLAMNFLEFFPLFLSRSTSRVLHLAGTGMIIILAFLFNIWVGGVSTPLSDFKAFLDSICGLWVLVLALESVSLRFILIPPGAPAEPSSPGSGAGERTVPNHSGKKTDIGSADSGSGDPASTGKASGTGEERPSSASYSPRTPQNRSSDSMAKAFLMAFAVVAILLPFANWRSFAQSSWMSSVHAITRFIFGDKIGTGHPALELLLYLLGLFAIAIFLAVCYTITRYVLARYFAHSASQEDFFEEYSTPIIIFVITGAIVLAIRSNVGAGSKGEPGWALMLGYITSIFTYMLVIIVAIIILLVAFEIVRLVLSQCMKPDSLLNGSMYMIFILVVEYAMGLLMGTLRIFALKDVIESLLLFFLPDLNQSVEPDIKRVLDAALKQEIQRVEKNMGLKSSGRQRDIEPKWPFRQKQRHRRSRHRFIQKRRRRK